MNRIPVGNTIRYAYSFTFGHLGAIIGLAWLPLVLVALLNFLPYLWSDRSVSDAGSAAGGILALADLAIAFATLLFYAMAYVPVTELALGLRHAGANIYFSLGSRVWKMFGALLLLLLLTMLFMFILMGGAGIVGWIAGLSLPKQAAAGVAGLAALVGLVFVFLLVLRLVFLLAPVIVSEDRIDLGHGWALLKGNVWRIVAITIAVFAPVFIIWIVAAYVIMGHDLALLSMVDPQTAPELFRQRMQALSKHSPVMMGIGLFLAPFSLGLVLGAEALAYRTLVPPGARNS